MHYWNIRDNRSNHIAAEVEVAAVVALAVGHHHSNCSIGMDYVAAAASASASASVAVAATELALIFDYWKLPLLLAHSVAYAQHSCCHLPSSLVLRLQVPQ